MVSVQVCSGLTDHAEPAQMICDPQKAEHGKLVDLLCSRHNSSTSNRAGNDVDTQCTFGRGIPARRAAALGSQVTGSVTEIAPQTIFGGQRSLTSSI